MLRDLSPAFGRRLGLRGRLCALPELTSRQAPSQMTVLVCCEVDVLQDEPHEALRLVTIGICGPLHTHGARLGKLLAGARADGACGLSHGAVRLTTARMLGPIAESGVPLAIIE